MKKHTERTRHGLTRAMRVSTILLAAGASGLAFVGAGISGWADVPTAQVHQSGKSLVVPTELASQGTVYHALTGRDRQIHFTSDAPLEQIKGQSNRVIGFAVSGDKSSPASLAGGEWQLPVDSLKTGIDLRDEHLTGKDWLDAEANPMIVFQLERVENPSETRRKEGFVTYLGTLVGEMTIHGETRPISIPDASLTFLTQSDKTQKIAQGNLLAIRAKYSVKLSDYGVSHPVVGDKVANHVEISTTLYLSTVPPESQPE